jgi:hypothetical protein
MLYLTLKIVGNFVIHWKVTAGFKEKTFTIQKATIDGKIPQAYNIYEDKKYDHYSCASSHLLYFISLWEENTFST